MKAKIYCEVTCCHCGGLAGYSEYYRNQDTIRRLKEDTKDRIYSEKHFGNLCPDCQKELNTYK